MRFNLYARQTPVGPVLKGDRMTSFGRFLELANEVLDETRRFLVPAPPESELTERVEKRRRLAERIEESALPFWKDTIAEETAVGRLDTTAPLLRAVYLGLLELMHDHYSNRRYGEDVVIADFKLSDAVAEAEPFNLEVPQPPNGVTPAEDKPAADTPPDDIITTADAAKLFGISATTVLRRFNARTLTSYRPKAAPKNGKHYFSESELEEHFSRPR